MKWNQEEKIFLVFLCMMLLPLFAGVTFDKANEIIFSYLNLLHE